MVSQDNWLVKCISWLDRILSHLNSVYTLLLYESILSSLLCKDLPSGFPTKILNVSLPACVLRVPTVKIDISNVEGGLFAACKCWQQIGSSESTSTFFIKSQMKSDSQRKTVTQTYMIFDVPEAYSADLHSVTPRNWITFYVMPLFHIFNMWFQ
jgi:hypothetical protein